MIHGSELVRQALLAGVLSGLSVTTVTARADEPNAAQLATARALFDEALAQEDSGAWDAALITLRKVAAIKTTPPVRFHIARCLEALGLWVEADGEYAHVESELRPETAPTAAQLLDATVLRRKELVARIPRLTITVSGDREGLVVDLDRVAVAPDLLGTPMLVDPGTHVVRLQRAGVTIASETAVALERGRVTVTLVAPRKTPTPLPVAPPPPGARPWPFILGGVGLAALGGAVISYSASRSTMRELDPVCGATRQDCPEDREDTARRGRTYTTVSNVLFGLSAAAFTAAVIIYVVTPSHASSSQLAIGVGARTAFLSVTF